MNFWHRQKDDFYITFLRFASEKTRVGDGTINYAEVYEHVHRVNGDVSEEVFKRIFLQSVVTIQHLGRQLLADDIESGLPVVLTIEAYFQLLEHQELQEARKASSTARNLALVAIAIATGSVLLSVLPQVFGTNETVIDGTQYQGIIDAIQAK